MNVADQIELIIPTYNRAGCLERTLRQLYHSPFRHSRITVLDNASTDQTKVVAKTASQILPNLVYVRNAENIGAERNYCRAVELARAPWVWVMGDDDEYRWWDGGRALVEELLLGLSARADVILPGVTFDPFDRLMGRHWLRDLIETVPGTVFALTFAPSMIFRRELYRTTTLAKAEWWATQGHLLPMLPFVEQLARGEAEVWIAPDRHIDKGRRHGYSCLNALRDWVLAARELPTIGGPMMRDMFGGLRGVRNVVAGCVCEPAASRWSGFAGLVEVHPPARWCAAAALTPEAIARVVREGLAMSRYDGGR